jgi:hypothetical protein
MRVPTRSAGGRELDAFEIPLHRVGQRFDRECLGQTRHAFYQQVALRQHGDHHALQKAVLPNDHAFDLVQNLFHQLGGVGFVCAHVRGPVSKKGG